MFTKDTRCHTIALGAYEIDPIAETHGEGNGWYRVPVDQAQGFEIYPADVNEDKVDEFFHTLDKAKEWIANN